MKFIVVALVGFTAFTVHPGLAKEQSSTCDIACIRPYNLCGWEAYEGKNSDCESKFDKCVKDCVAKNGLKEYVYVMIKFSHVADPACSSTDLHQLAFSYNDGPASCISMQPVHSHSRFIFVSKGVFL